MKKEEGGVRKINLDQGQNQIGKCYEHELYL